jgi:DNA replication initiation complex subunit (GINS family)
MGDANITYETLFELLRREKNREPLQKLDDTFFNDILSYLGEKRKQMEELKIKEDMFAADERKKADIQDENIRKIIRELYERRERKIIAMAVDKSRSKQSIIDISALLREEKVFYEIAIRLLDCFREGVLHKLLSAKEPKLDMSSEIMHYEESECAAREPEVKTAAEKMIKVSEFVPVFLGVDLKEYGPFEQDSVVSLPEDIAAMLVDKGSAEETH